MFSPTCLHQVSAFTQGGPNRLDLFYLSALTWLSCSYYLVNGEKPNKGLLYMSKMTIKINLNMRNDSLFHGCVFTT